MDKGMTDEEFKKAVNEGRRSTISTITIAVYKNPTDFPNKYVARSWLITGNRILVSRKIFIVRDNINDIRAAIPLDMTRMDRFENDPKCILETYI